VKAITGYRLHKERLLLSGGGVVRTIKYPIVPLNHASQKSKEFLKQFERGIIEDDLKIRGSLNLNDYLRDKDCYTLFDFWEDSLRAGVLWMPKVNDLIDFFNQEHIDHIWQNASSKITYYFEKDKFKEILKRIPVRKTKKRANFLKDLLSSVKKDFLQKGKDGEYEVINQEVNTLIGSIVNTFYDKDGRLVLEGEKNQSKFWKEEYGLDVYYLKQIQPAGDYQKITFVIVPELIELEKNSSLENLLDKRREWLLSCFKKEEVKKEELEKILGLSDNFNAFSNYFGVVLQGLQNGKTTEIFEAHKTIYPEVEKDSDKIKKALDFLAEKAKKIGKTKLSGVNGWHEYRSIFGGKLQSWFSNYQRRKNELGEQIDKLKIGLDKTKNYLEDTKFDSDEESRQKKEHILSLLARLKEVTTEEGGKSIENEKDYLLFNDLLAQVRSNLKFFYEKYIKEEGEEKPVNQFGEFKYIYQTIHKPVAFYGDVAKTKNEKIINKTFPILKDGIENIKKIVIYLKESFFPEDFLDQKSSQETYKKSLQFFWNKYKENALNSLEFRNYYREILKEATADDQWQELQKKENKGRYVYYKSPYAKGTLREIKTKEVKDFSERVTELYFRLAEKVLSYEKNNLLKDEKILLDWLEIAKHIVAKLLDYNTKERFHLKNLSVDNLEKLKRYVDLFRGDGYSKSEYGFITQNLIFSEIRGAAALFSKKEYTAKYSVQVVSSDNKFKIFYFKKGENEIDKSYLEERKKLMLPHHYAVALREVKTKKKGGGNSIVLEKNGFYPVFVNHDSKDYLFRLSSSPYQLQFLDKFLYHPKGWEDIDIALSEWSFVLEKRFSIKWDLQEEKPKFNPINEGKKAQKNKLYIAIPFNLTPSKQAQKNAPLKIIAKKGNKRDLSRIDYPILGVDVGEYGLAYCLIKIIYEQKPQNVKAIEILKDEKEKPVCGFIEDRNIANIKDKFSEIQKRSKLGSFDEADTVVSRVRENAVGNLRNKVHAVITINKGLSLVYEDSISNFETGSGRTTKIYNSVKRADTKFETEADKAEHSHVWGKKTAIIGRDLSAYASSYTCIKCSHSLYEIKKSDLPSMKVIDVDGRILAITTPYGNKTTIRAYTSEKEKYKTGYQFCPNDEEFKIFRKMVRDFARPPLSRNSEVLLKFASGLTEKNKIEMFKKSRGNSSVFLCPFCGFIADADIQAAFFMALRGYLRFSNTVSPSGKENNEKTTWENFLEKTQKILQKVEGKEITKYISLRF